MRKMNKINALIFSFVLISILLSFVNIVYSQKATPLIPEGDPNNLPRYGLFGNLNLNQHNANFTGRQLPFPSCCPKFEEGSGLGFSAGLLFEYPIINNLFIGLRAGYYSLNGKLIAEENETVYDYQRNMETNGVFEHSLDSKLSFIGIEPMLNYRIFDNLFVHLGATLGLLNISKSYSHTESLIKPEIGAFENNSRQRLIFPDYEIANLSSIKASLLGGLSYEIPIVSSGEWIIAPEAFYNLMLTNIVDTANFDWKINTLRFGASVKYKPLPEPVKPIPAKPILFATTMASALDDKDNEAQIVRMKVEEYLSTNVKPLLTYIFFEENSSDIPKRYKLLTPEETRKFTIDQTFHLNNLETYYHVLNIIGKRMQEYPDAKIAIDGCNSDTGPEKGNLALSEKRAENVRNYLRDVWGISPDRMIVGKRNLPQEPTNIRDPDGIQENRRVEITSNKWEIIAPIFANDTFRVTTPPTVRFRNNVNSEAGVKNWQLIAYQKDRTLQTFSGNTEVPQILDWRLDNEQDNIPRTSDLLNYKLNITDNQNQKFETEVGSIPVELVTVQKKRRERIKDKYIDRYSLILFSYDESKLSFYNAKMADLIKQSLKPTSFVRIYGHTDRMGAEDYNQRLSLQRANAVNDYLKFTNTEINGFGEKYLIYNNDLPEGRFYSRRVDIVVESPIEE